MISTSTNLKKIEQNHPIYIYAYKNLKEATKRVWDELSHKWRMAIFKVYVIMYMHLCEIMYISLEFKTQNKY